MTKLFNHQASDMTELYSGLLEAAKNIYETLKEGAGLSFVESQNHTGDIQIGLDVIADEAFFNYLSTCEKVKYVVSEERAGLIKLSEEGYSIALDPLDGSKAALVGIPSGAIFGVYKDVETESDFNGSNIVSSGFFVFGMNLEVFLADGGLFFKGFYDYKQKCWKIEPSKSSLLSSNMIAVNAAHQTRWPKWFQKFYLKLISETLEGQKPFSLRCYGSMVSEIKRVICEGGLFAYPSDSRIGYENGHLRLVYEAIPMAFIINSIGGSSSNGLGSILNVNVRHIHQKTPVFIGEKKLIKSLEAHKRGKN